MDGRFMMPHHKKKAMVRRLIYRGQGRAFSISAFKTSRSTSFIIPLVFFKKTLQSFTNMFRQMLAFSSSQWAPVMSGFQVVLCRLCCLLRTV